MGMGIMGILSSNWVLFSPSVKKGILIKKLLICATVSISRSWGFV